MRVNLRPTDIIVGEALTALGNDRCAASLCVGTEGGGEGPGRREEGEGTRLRAPWGAVTLPGTEEQGDLWPLKRRLIQVPEGSGQGLLQVRKTSY